LHWRALAPGGIPGHWGQKEKKRNAAPGLGARGGTSTIAFTSDGLYMAVGNGKDKGRMLRACQRSMLPCHEGWKKSLFSKPARKGKRENTAHFVATWSRGRKKKRQVFPSLEGKKEGGRR